MKEAILISIKPEWCEKILNGEKTIEIRKKMPKCELPIDVYIYCTKDPKHLVAPFRFKQGWAYREYNDDTYYSRGCTVNVGEDINGKVVAKFTLNKVDEVIMPVDFTEENPRELSIINRSCLTGQELLNYLGGSAFKNFYAWHIDNLEIFDKPKELSEFKTPLFHCFNIKNVECVENVFGEYVFKHYENSFCKICKHIDDFGDCGKKGRKTLTKAPQSWCYVEVE